MDHLRERFQRKYGYRGQNLIEQLGNGYFRYSSGYVPCYSCKYWSVSAIVAQRFEICWKKKLSKTNEFGNEILKLIVSLVLFFVN